MNPIVSVLLPVYNGELYLRFAIDSIISQTFIEWELIIINDGSYDKSREIIDYYDDSRIVAIHSDRNRGLITSLNIGIRSAHGKFIARMDADDIALTTRFQEQVRYLHEHPEVGVVGSNANLINAEGKYISKIRMPKSHHVILWEMMFQCSLLHPTVMMRTDLLKKVGGYSTDCIHSEDYELWYRLSLVTKFHNIQLPLLGLRKHSQNVSHVHQTIQLNNSNKIRFKFVSHIGKESDNYLKSFKKDYIHIKSNSVNIYLNQLMSLLDNYYQEKHLTIKEYKSIKGFVSKHMLRTYYFNYRKQNSERILIWVLQNWSSLFKKLLEIIFRKIKMRKQDLLL